jgi:pyruvate dehydrogenase E1 component
VVAATDYMKLYAEQLRPFIPRRYWCWARTALAAATPAPNCVIISRWTQRYVVIAALKLLAEEGALPVAKVSEAIEKYGIAADKPNPVTV